MSAKAYAFMASSLDGYIARKNGDLDWLPDTLPELVETASMPPATLLVWLEEKYGVKKVYVDTGQYIKERFEQMVLDPHTDYLAR